MSYAFLFVENGVLSIPCAHTMSEVETASVVLEEEEETPQEAGVERVWADEDDRRAAEAWRDVEEHKDQEGTGASETFDDWFGLDDRHLVTLNGQIRPSEVEGHDIELYVDGQPLSRALDEVGLAFYREVFLPQLLDMGRASFRGAVENGEVLDGSVTELHGTEATITFGMRVRAEDRWYEDELFLPPFEERAGSDAAVPDTTVHEAPLELVLDEAVLATVRIDQEVALTTEPATVFETTPHNDLAYAAGAEVETTSPGGRERVHTPEPAATQSARSLMIEDVTEERTVQDATATSAPEQDAVEKSPPVFAHPTRVEDEPPAENALTEPPADAAEESAPDTAKHAREEEIERSRAEVPEQRVPLRERDDKLTSLLEAAGIPRVHAENPEWRERAERAPGVDRTANRLPDALGSVPREVSSESRRMIESVAEEPMRLETLETPAADRDAQEPAQPDFAQPARAEEEPSRRDVSAEPVADRVLETAPATAGGENVLHEANRDHPPPERSEAEHVLHKITQHADRERASTVRVGAPRDADAEIPTMDTSAGASRNAEEHSTPDHPSYTRRNAREQETEMERGDSRPPAPHRPRPVSEQESVSLGARSAPPFSASVNVPATLPATRAAGTET